MKRLGFFILLAGLLNPAWAQNFTWKSALDPVKATGFYTIRLKPDVISKSAQAELQDIRVYNGKNEVPYILQREAPAYDQTSFIPLEIIRDQKNARGISEVVFNKGGVKRLEQFQVIYNSSWVPKKLNISGSYDNKQWYIIDQDVLINPSEVSTNSGGTAMIKSMKIPATDYSYYKLEMNDSTSAPLYISKIVIINSTLVSANAYSAIPQPQIKIIKSQNSGETTFQLDFDAPYLINRLSVEIEEPRLFKRDVTLYLPNAEARQKRKHREAYQYITEVSLDPGNLTIELPETLKTKTLLLVVRNGDNPPLQLKKALAWQQNYFLLTYLEKDKNHEIKLGDRNLRAPDYDLSYFTDSIKGKIPSLNTAKPEYIAGEESINGSSAKNPTVFKSNYWIWAALAIIIVLLGFFSVRMIKDMQKPEN